MKSILSKSKIGTVLLVIFLIISIQYLGLSKYKRQSPAIYSSKNILSVSDAKEYVMKKGIGIERVNIKGIYSDNRSLDKYSIQLEDQEPSGLEDLVLICHFNLKELNALQLKPGAEITVNGKISRKYNYIEVTDCKLICINEGVLLNDFTEITE